ncbi:hypothetical protein OS493_026341 [Desmophyllum pertusum]|uniref:Uncharacterized protein n=1 Tax=Desmophyllum pertusum TaxID=174260 RepID=A0A9X0CY68_9CNID|nr:hypothetical protein OS493_026341 [Desmophyllum pertusum]
MEPEYIFEGHVQGQQRENGSNIYIDFLHSVRNGTEEEVRKCLLRLSSDDTGRRAAIEEENDEDDLSQKQKLLEALENKDVGTTVDQDTLATHCTLAWNGCGGITLKAEKHRVHPTKQREKESKFEDVIEAALDDAYLLEKIALYEHHYSRDEYTRRALECEKFAADVVEGSNLGQLHEIMDIKGNGCLLLEKPKDFNQSLSLLKLAADKERKRFVSSPKMPIHPQRDHLL